MKMVKPNEWRLKQQKKLRPRKERLRAPRKVDENLKYIRKNIHEDEYRRPEALHNQHRKNDDKS